MQSENKGMAKSVDEIGIHDFLPDPSEIDKEAAMTTLLEEGGGGVLFPVFSAVEIIED